ncbi:MAG: O-antigen ligase family protein [Caldilineaceae bacterium]
MNSSLSSNQAIEEWIWEHEALWRPLLVILAVFGVCVVGPFVLPTKLLMLLPALPFGIAAMLVLLRKPLWGLVALVATIIVPIDGPSGVNASMGLTALLLGLWLLKMVAETRRFAIFQSPAVMPLVIFTLVQVLSFLVGQLPWYSLAPHAPLGAQLGSMTLYILSFGLFLYAANQVDDIVWLKRLTFLYIGVGFLYIFKWMLPPWGPVADALFTRGAFGSLLWMWLVILSFSQAVYNRDLPPLRRLALVGVLLATLYVCVFKLWDWNSGWMPACVAIGVILLASIPRLGIFVSALAMIGIIYKLQDVFQSMMGGDNAYSLSTRLEAWGIVWDISTPNLVLGLGPANYYWYTPLFPIRGWSVSFNSHSQYIDLIAQSGFLGLFCFIWFFGVVGVLAWRLRNRVEDGFSYAFTLGAIGGVAGTFTSAALGDWVLPFFYNIGMTGFRTSMLSWLFLGGFMALYHMTEQREKEKLAAEKFARTVAALPGGQPTLGARAG